MSKRLAALLFTALPALAWAAAAPSPRGTHPIVGTWTFTVPNTQCSEIYRYRADGTSAVTSGQERAESRYQLSPQPTPLGYYKFVDTVTRDNGGKDCTGHVTPVGDRATLYLRFDPSGRMFLMCQAESLDRCFGPLRRIND
jgi:hypothetical protein